MRCRDAVDISQTNTGLDSAGALVTFATKNRCANWKIYLGARANKAKSLRVNFLEFNVKVFYTRMVKQTS